MDAKTALTQLAILEANRLVERAAQRKPELRELELKKAQIESALHAADLAHQRSLNFSPVLDGDFQCPSCWVANEKRSSLTPVDGANDTDIFRCKVCGFDWNIDI